MFYPDGSSTFRWLSYNFKTEEYECSRCGGSLPAPRNGACKSGVFEREHDNCVEKRKPMIKWTIMNGYLHGMNSRGNVAYDIRMCIGDPDKYSLYVDRHYAGGKVEAVGTITELIEKAEDLEQERHDQFIAYQMEDEPNPESKYR